MLQISLACTASSKKIVIEQMAEIAELWWGNNFALGRSFVVLPHDNAKKDTVSYGVSIFLWCSATSVSVLISVGKPFGTSLRERRPA